MVASACTMASSSASRVWALAVRKMLFSFDQQRSIGARSGEYGGKYSAGR